MRKSINFPPYNEAEVKQILEDGSLLCDLYGPEHNDTDILFPPHSQVLSLTGEEREQFEEGAHLF